MNSKIAKLFLSLTLSFCLFVIPFGCAKPDNDDNDNGGSNTTIVTPDGEEINVSKYSKLLQDVLSDTYYNNLMATAKSSNAFYEYPVFDPHPYDFLADNGHDVSAIKNKELDCFTTSFIKETEPNSLYIATKVENVGNYYTEYLIKYALNDKEIEDYKALHEYDNGFHYTQSAFLNDAISKTKQPTILSKTNVDIESHEEMFDELLYKRNNSLKKYIDYKISKSLDFIITDVNTTDKTYNYFVWLSNPNYALSEEKTAIYPFKATLDYKNNIFYGPASTAVMFYYEKVDQSVTNTMIFDTQDLVLTKDYLTVIKN